MTDANDFQFSSERLDPGDGSADTDALLAYWRGKCAGRRFPARADVDPIELRPYLGNISLLEVRREPLDFVFRIAGTRVAGDTGYDLTGRSVRSIRPPEWAENVLAEYTEAVAAAAPRLHRIELRIGAETMRYLRLTLPLGQDDTVAMLLTYSERPTGFRRFMARLDD